MKLSVKLLFIGLFIFSLNDAFAQSKKEQLQILSDRLDSLTKVLEQERVICKQGFTEIKLQLDSMSFQFHKSEKEREGLIFREKSLNNQFLSLSHQIGLLEDSLIVVNRVLRTFRDRASSSSIEFLGFPDASPEKHPNKSLFNKQEINHLIDYFSAGLRRDFGVNQVIKVNVNGNGDIGESITVSIKGDLGYVPAIDIPLHYLSSLRNDLDSDGNQDIIFEAGVTGGGTAYWSELYCLTFMPDSIIRISRINIECPCEQNYQCYEPNTEVIDVRGNKLLIKSRCFGPDDANCCPSQIFNVWYAFSEGMLKLMNL
jgi:hypothetical protein